jgi:hypothetical protein
MPVITPVLMVGVGAIGVATDSRRQRAGRRLAEAVSARRRVWAVVWQALSEGSGRRAESHCERRNEFSHKSMSA